MTATIAESKAVQIAALVELIARVEAADSPEHACRLLVESLQTYFGCEQVVIGLCRERASTCRVAAISGVDGIRVQDEPVRLAQAALQETIARGEFSVWPATSHDGHAALLAHRQYAIATNVAACVSCPLRDGQGRTRGVLLVAGNEEEVRRAEVVNFLRAAAAPLASSLHLLERAHNGRLYESLVAGRRLLAERRGRAALAIVALAVALLSLPVRYRVSCDCTLEPVTRRYVAAPFDASLEKAFVKPGDLVAKDELLARLDGREIQWELSGTRADLHRATKEYTGHMAAHEIGKAQVAKHEVQRLKLRTELLEHRGGQLEIRSPIDGLVVSGDWEDAVGVPLTVGKTLFEIAPLHEMVVELAIPEDDIAHVKSGMPVHIRFVAYPQTRLEATVERIQPRAELRDDRNVFIAEVRLDNPHQRFRPGMRGNASIVGARHCLAWNLFHRPIASLLAWLGW